MHNKNLFVIIIKSGVKMECAICYEKYNENLLPMVLLCGHSFCTECTKKLENRESIKCPMCKKITAIAIPPNTHIYSYFH